MVASVAAAEIQDEERMGEIIRYLRILEATELQHVH